MKTLETLITRLTIYFLEKGYGKGCEVCDIDTFYPEPVTCARITSSGRCVSCRSKEVVLFLREHVKLLKM